MDTCSWDEWLLQIKARLVCMLFRFKGHRIRTAKCEALPHIKYKAGDEVVFGRHGWGEFDMLVQCSKRSASGSHVCMASADSGEVDTDAAEGLRWAMFHIMNPYVTTQALFFICTQFCLFGVCGNARLTTFGSRPLKHNFGTGVLSLSYTLRNKLSIIFDTSTKHVWQTTRKW